MSVRRIATVLGSRLVMLIARQAGAAVADHTPTVTATACVTDTDFRFQIQANNISVSKNVANNQNVSGLAHNENFVVYLAISGVDTVTVALDNGVAGSGNNWALGKFSHTTSATRLSETDDLGFYDIEMDGVILHGTTPYVSGNVWPVARMLDKELGSVIQTTNIPITDCDEPPASSTTTEATTTTEAVTTTTAAATTTTAAPLLEAITVTEICDDGVDVLRIENVHDYYITYSIFLDGVLFEEDYETYDGDVDDFPLPTGHSKYSTTWYEEYENDDIIDGPSGDLPICAQATTTTIPEVETDIGNSNSADAALLGMLAVGLSALAGAAVLGQYRRRNQ